MAGFGCGAFASCQAESLGCILHLCGGRVPVHVSEDFVRFLRAEIPASIGVAVINGSALPHVSCYSSTLLALQQRSWKNPAVAGHPPKLLFHMTEGTLAKSESKRNELCTAISKYSLSKLPSWAPPNLPPLTCTWHTVVLPTGEVIIPDTTGDMGTSHQVREGKEVSCLCSLCSSFVFRFS